MSFNRDWESTIKLGYKWRHSTGEDEDLLGSVLIFFGSDLLRRNMSSFCFFFFFFVYTLVYCVLFITHVVIKNPTVA